MIAIQKSQFLPVFHPPPEGTGEPSRIMEEVTLPKHMSETNAMRSKSTKDAFSAFAKPNAK